LILHEQLFLNLLIFREVVDQLVREVINMPRPEDGLVLLELFL